MKPLSKKKTKQLGFQILVEFYRSVADLGFKALQASKKSKKFTEKNWYANGFADGMEANIEVQRMRSKLIKSQQWGHIWAYPKESLETTIDNFWGSMGHKWTVDDCLKDIERAKEETPTKAKAKIYRVVLEEVPEFMYRKDADGLCDINL